MKGTIFSFLLASPDTVNVSSRLVFKRMTFITKVYFIFVSFSLL